MPDLPSAAPRSADGRYLGLGVGNGVKGTARPFESGTVRIGSSAASRSYTGAMPDGARHSHRLAQICAEQFGVAPADDRLRPADTLPSFPMARAASQPADHHGRLGRCTWLRSRCAEALKSRHLLE